MKILLTGGTGFIGGKFLRAALAAGHEIAALISGSKQPPQDVAQNKNCRWLPGILESAPWKVIEDFAPEICVHCAWITTPGVYLESPENLRFKTSSLEFISSAHRRGVRHFVVLGTCMEYKITGKILSENGELEATTNYSRCKIGLHDELKKFIAREGGSLCWGRVFYPYGPGEHPSRLASAIIHKLSRNEKMLLKTPDSTKDYLHIEDLASALLTVVEKKFGGDINLGTGVPVTVREIAETLAGFLQKTGLIEFANPPEKDPLGFVVADASRLRSLGWSPKYSIDTGLETMLS